MTNREQALGMAAGEHTPGSWRVGDAGMTVFGPKNGTPSPETIANVRRRANARLIAAAPDMLVFCKRVAATKPVLATEADLLKGWITMIAEARAIIARATGK